MKYIIGHLSNVDKIKAKILEEIDTSNEMLEINIGPVKDSRSLQQNNMQFQWYLDAEKQGDLTALEYRAYCKLHFGVPILRVESDEFRAIYDEAIRPLPYEVKLKLMCGAIDFPVTSRMTVKQNSKYLDAVHNFLTVDQGFQITEPVDEAA